MDAWWPWPLKWDQAHEGSKHDQEGQDQSTPGTPHPPPWGSTFRIYHLDIEEKQRNGRGDGKFKFA